MTKPFFSCTNCGACCGPVPITRTEHVRIKRALRRMDPSEITRLQGQERDALTCILWDTDNKRCSIYDSRPDICRMFGFYEGMECPNNPGFATGSQIEGARRVAMNTVADEIAGVLSVDITWGNGL